MRVAVFRWMSSNWVVAEFSPCHTLWFNIVSPTLICYHYCIKSYIAVWIKVAPVYFPGQGSRWEDCLSSLFPAGSTGPRRIPRNFDHIKGVENRLNYTLNLKIPCSVFATWIFVWVWNSSFWQTGRRFKSHRWCMEFVTKRGVIATCVAKGLNNKVAPK